MRISMGTQSTKVEAAGAEKLIGSVRRAGTFGPFYQVVAVHNGTAEIEFPESGQKASLPVEAVREDPVKD